MHETAVEHPASCKNTRAYPYHVLKKAVRTSEGSEVLHNNTERMLEYRLVVRILRRQFFDSKKGGERLASEKESILHTINLFDCKIAGLKTRLSYSFEEEKQKMLF